MQEVIVLKNFITVAKLLSLLIRNYFLVARKKEQKHEEKIILNRNNLKRTYFPLYYNLIQSVTVSKLYFKITKF